LTFREEARAAAIAWKEMPGALPDAARPPAPYARRPGSSYPFCIPEQFASLNLLDDARGALEVFRRDGIAWHDDVNGGPSNHLLDSQVQCVNALAPFLRDGPALAHIFGRVLDVEEMLPFVDDGTSDELIAFEWIGAADYLGERTRGGGRRGANTTSADAAIRYRTSRGLTEVALIEWKYTEQYQDHELSGGEKSMGVRLARYRELYDDPDSPIRDDLLPYDDLFVEPFYQLFRLTLLADLMERAAEQGADRVRLLYVAPARNTELWTSLNRASHRALAAQLCGGPEERPVEEVWSAMCKRPDRFVFLDGATFVDDGAPTSEQYRSRYGHVAGTASPPPIGRLLAPTDVPAASEFPLDEPSWDGSWAAWLPLAWAAAVGQGGVHPVPEPPMLTTSFDSFVGPLAWWTPLPHLLAYSFGWEDLARGLRAWNELGRPIDDSRLELIDLWWGDATLALARWLEVRRGDESSAARIEQRSAAPAADHEGPNLARWTSELFEGGSDPLHLSVHAPIDPIEDRYIGAEAAEGAHVFLDVSGLDAVVVFDRYEGWYEGLAQLAIEHGFAPGVHIDVICRQAGSLGRYRCSPVTERWFAGPHRIHLFGH
jgi:hypothetical protein